MSALPSVFGYILSGSRYNNMSLYIELNRHSWITTIVVIQEWRFSSISTVKAVHSGHYLEQRLLRGGLIAHAFFIENTVWDHESWLVFTG